MEKTAKKNRKKKSQKNPQKINKKSIENDKKIRSVAERIFVVTI